MLEFLDRLRAKPLRERKRIAFGSTISIFAVIVLVWWTTFTNPLSNETIKATDNVATPINVMGGFFGQLKEGAQALPQQIKSYVENVATGTGKTAGNADMNVSAGELLHNTASTSSSDASTTPKMQTPPPTPTAPAPKTEMSVTPPFTLPSAPVPTKVTPPPTPMPTIVQPPQPPSPPANLIPTRPGSIAPSNG